MQKPQPCKQNWAEMKPTEGGRVCSQCEKTIVDFSNMKWQQIHNFQADRNFEICGFYNPKQLEYWGQEIPKKSCLNFAKSAAIITSLFLGNEIQAQISKTAIVAIRFILVDELDLPIKNARVTLDGFLTMTTDENGEFLYAIEPNEFIYGLNIDAEISTNIKKVGIANKNLLNGHDLVLKNIINNDSLEIKNAANDKMPLAYVLKDTTESVFLDTGQIRNSPMRTISFYASSQPTIYIKEPTFFDKLKSLFRKNK